MEDLSDVCSTVTFRDTSTGPKFTVSILDSVRTSSRMMDPLLATWIRTPGTSRQGRTVRL